MAGNDPAHPRWQRDALPVELHPRDGRGDTIRTCVGLLPKQMGVRYPTPRYWSAWSDSNRHDSAPRAEASAWLGYMRVVAVPPGLEPGLSRLRIWRLVQFAYGTVGPARVAASSLDDGPRPPSPGGVGAGKLVDPPGVQPGPPAFKAGMPRLNTSDP